MKALAFSLALVAGVSLAVAASAQPPGGAPAGPQPPNLVDMPGATVKAHLTVTSAEFKYYFLIPYEFSSFF